MVDQMPLGLDRVDQQRRQEQIAFRADLAGEAPGKFDRVGQMGLEHAPEQGNDAHAFAPRRSKAGERGGQGAPPADADRAIVRDRLRQELAERQADGLGGSLRIVRTGHDDRLVEAERLFERHGELDAFVDPLMDPELNLAALHRLVEHADDRRPADAELLGNVLLRQALVVVEPGGAQPKRRRFRKGLLCATSELDQHDPQFCGRAAVRSRSRGPERTAIAHACEAQTGARSAQLLAARKA